MPNSDGTMTSREYRRARHLCRECGQRDAYTENGRLYCAVCRERENENRRELTADQKRRRAERENALREKRKSEGICTKCGKRSVAPGYQKCAVCRAAHRIETQKSRKKHGVISRDAAADLGICTRCMNAPAVDGQKLCAECGAWWESIRNNERVDNAFTRNLDAHFKAYTKRKNRGESNGEV